MTGIRSAGYPPAEWSAHSRELAMAADNSSTATAATPQSGLGLDRFSVRLESLLVLVVLIVALSILSPYFLSVSNFLNILLATAVIGILGFGATFVIAAAGIDLSLGSVLALSGVIGALSVNALNLPWPVAIVTCLAVGAFCGLINGVLNAKAGIPAFIVTLGMLGVARGLGLVFTNGQPVYGMPDPIVFLGQGRPFGVPDMSEHAARIKLADELGFRAAWVRDVPLYDPDFGDAAQVFETFTYLGYLSSLTRNILLGTAAVVLPLRQPWLVRKAASTLQTLSGDRLLLGVVDLRVEIETIRNARDSLLGPRERLNRRVHHERLPPQTAFSSVKPSPVMSEGIGS